MARNHIILKFLLLSTVAHTLALASWPTRESPKTPISATLSVGFVALERTSASPAPPSAIPAKAKSSPPATAPAAIARTKSTRTVTSQQVPSKRRNSRRAAGPAVATTAMRERSQTLIAKTGQTQQGSQTSRSPVEKSAPATARPRQSSWGSVRYHSAEEQLRTANTAAALLQQPKQQLPTPIARVTNMANTSEAARAFIRGHLETDLSRFFSYPPIARQRGWQGHVRVAFTVQADGRLTDARITRSSGYHVLDASALEALRRVGRLPQAREWLHGQALPMELPVIYRLEN